MSYREQLICLITLAILISGHDPATVTKWEDMDCSIHIYASHYYKGEPNFSWRIKKSDHQRPNTKPRSAVTFFEPRSVRTTGTCPWSLCSTRRLCHRIQGGENIPYMSGRGKWTKSHRLAYVKLAKTGANRHSYRALPLVMKDNINLDDMMTSPKATDSEEVKAVDATTTSLKANDEYTTTITLDNEAPQMQVETTIKLEEADVTEEPSQESPTTTPLEGSSTRPQQIKASVVSSTVAQDWRYKLQTFLRLSQQRPASRRRQKDLESPSTTSPKLQSSKPTTFQSTATLASSSAATSELEKMSPPNSHQQSSHQASSLDPMTTTLKPKETWHSTTTEVAWDTSSHYFVGELPSQTLLSSPALDSKQQQPQKQAKRTIAEFLLICFAILLAAIFVAVSFILAFKRLLHKMMQKTDFYLGPGIKEKSSQEHCQKYKFTLDSDGKSNSKV